MPALLFTFLFTKICVSKNPSLQTPGTLDILATLQWHFLFHRHWTPNESVDSSNFHFLLIFSSPASPALSPPLFFLVRPLFCMLQLRMRSILGSGALLVVPLIKLGALFANFVRKIASCPGSRTAFANAVRELGAARLPSRNLFAI